MSYCREKTEDPRWPTLSLVAGRGVARLETGGFPDKDMLRSQRMRECARSYLFALHGYEDSAAIVGLGVVLVVKRGISLGHQASCP